MSKELSPSHNPAEVEVVTFKNGLMKMFSASGDVHKFLVFRS